MVASDVHPRDVFVTLGLLGTLGSAGCGGGGGSDGMALISGSVTGQYAGSPFTPAFGFAQDVEGTGLIGLAGNAIGCGPSEAPEGVTALDGSFEVSVCAD